MLIYCSEQDSVMEPSLQSRNLVWFTRSYVMNKGALWVFTDSCAKIPWRMILRIGRTIEAQDGPFVHLSNEASYLSVHLSTYQV